MMGAGRHVTRFTARSGSIAAWESPLDNAGRKRLSQGVDPFSALVEWRELSRTLDGV